MFYCPYERFWKQEYWIFWNLLCLYLVFTLQCDEPDEQRILQCSSCVESSKLQVSKLLLRTLSNYYWELWVICTLYIGISNRILHELSFYINFYEMSKGHFCKLYNVSRMSLGHIGKLYNVSRMSLGHLGKLYNVSRMSLGHLGKLYNVYRMSFISFYWNDNERKIYFIM